MNFEGALQHVKTTEDVWMEISSVHCGQHQRKTFHSEISSLCFLEFQFKNAGKLDVRRKG